MLLRTRTRRLRRSPGTPEVLLREQFETAVPFMYTAEAEQAGYGFMRAEKWAATQALQVKYGNQQHVVPDAQLWTNQFLQVAD